MGTSLFHHASHPFVWSTAGDRTEIVRNIEEPVWHRFLEEADKHFAAVGGLRWAAFPLFCHDGDLDEVMAMAVLAYVRNDAKSWHWVGDWLRGVLAYYREASPVWRENRRRIMRGDLGCMPPGWGNPRQFFEGFTRGGLYWVEAGFSSVVLHLVDLLEAYAPTELGEVEKMGLLEALADYAARYAFHEEALKYNNRGIWANAGVLLAAISQADPKTAQVLRHQAVRRSDELQNTFLDDGFHIEGSSDYHLMAADGLLASMLTASGLGEDEDLFAARTGEGAFQRHPSFVGIVRAYLRTAIPGPVLWNNPRGCSVSIPLSIRPSLLHAWKMTRDPEIGWFLRERMEAKAEAIKTPLAVTPAALLGLGQYQPLLNFWLYRPVEADQVRVPQRTRDILPDHGALFSRSGWDTEASCVTARFGYEGSGKGHRDHAHVAVTVGGVGVLKDPFPRCGPKGLDSSPFHNTVTLDQREPAPVIGILRSIEGDPSIGADAFLIANGGGTLPDRLFLHDPRDETNYWFTNSPEVADFEFQRAILHVHDRGVVLVDRLVADQPRRIDWFFHSELMPVGYEPEAMLRTSDYQLRQRHVEAPAQTLGISLRGPVVSLERGAWHEVSLGGAPLHAQLRMVSPDSLLQVETGHWLQEEKRSNDGISFREERDYFIRARAEAQEVHAVWVLSWKGKSPEVFMTGEGARRKIAISGWDKSLEWMIDFGLGQMSLLSPGIL